MLLGLLHFAPEHSSPSCALYPSTEGPVPKPGWSWVISWLYLALPQPTQGFAVSPVLSKLGWHSYGWPNPSPFSEFTIFCITPCSLWFCGEIECARGSGQKPEGHKETVDNLPIL